jgi:hypothetical protein
MWNQGESAGVARALDELLPDLGASLQEAAREAAMLASRLGTGDAGVLAPYAAPLPGEVALHDARARGEALVLALPCTAPSLALLARLVRAAPDAVHVLRTPLTERFAGACGPLRLAAPAEMVKIARGGSAATSPPLLVTFPDHQPAPAGTGWGVRFFGQVHAFATVEAVLLARGARGLLALGAGPALVHADAAVLGGGMQALLDWLALRMEEALRAAPAQALSWEWIQRRSLRAMREREALRRTLVADLIRAWHSAHPAAPHERVAAALDSLRALPELPAALAGGLR